jgi:Dyp-type peroxidase family
VYRRLRQDVGGFISFVTSEAETLGITPDQLGAKLVGRWKTGAPLEHVPGEPPDLDTAAADPSNAHPNVLDANHINNFGYLEHDADGHLTPRAAHIRKAYPRDEPPPGAEEANRHRILRRGIVYGAEFDPSEPAYGTDPVPADQDRGLLFLCYQSSIPRGFEFIQTSWANQPDFPQPGDGEDPIISQNVEHPPFTLPPNTHLATNRWVTTTGGEYFFAPAISALKLIGEASSDT